MAGFDFEKARGYLHKFQFKELFVDLLGWENPNQIRQITAQVEDCQYKAVPISHLAGVAVFEVASADCQIPNKTTRTAVQQQISKLHHENLIIFLDRDRTQSLWLWVKRENGKLIPREHYYLKGQPGDLFISKLGGMFVDISEYDADGKIKILDALKKITSALDVEKTTKKFYLEYAEKRLEFVELIEGINDDNDRRWYASVLLNRLMFVYFLQRKGFIDHGDLNYLQNKLARSQQKGKDLYYSDFLRLLFFEGFAKPEDKRSPEALSDLGKIRYLNGGLFLEHWLEQKWKGIKIPDKAFENILDLFSSYSWNLDDTPGGNDNEINPDVLGYIFEKYINQKSFGAYYTCPEITEYLCEHTINKVILDRIHVDAIPGITAERSFDSVDELLIKLDARLCKELLVEILPKLSLLDPACGSGAFLVAAMKTLINIYSAIIGKIEFLADPWLTQWLAEIRAKHPSISYFIKKQIITNNLFGVDIMAEAGEIARLRLFLALVASVEKVDQLEPLPNIDFNLLTGNSLIGLLRVDETAFNKKNPQAGLFQKTYRQLVEEKQRNLAVYKNTAAYYEDLRGLRNEIEKQRNEAYFSLNDLLLNEFSNLGIKVEQSTWDDRKGKEGKKTKRAVQIADIEKQTPFHWGYEFDEVMNTRGGFDAIITNPPWDIFKPNGKEFFQEYSELVTKKKMTILDFEKQMEEMLKNDDIRSAWFEYQDQFPHISAYYRSAQQYINQISVVNGKKQGTDINLYKLFVEQCYNLLRDSGLCGMVIPSGIHTDLGTFQLRKMLFEKTQMDGLFGFENRKGIFEGVHKSFKFDILTFTKGRQTEEFPSAFMRHEVNELADFPRQDSLRIQVDLIKRLSPDSWSVMEFKSEMDVQIAEKMAQFPLLGDDVEGKPFIELTREFDMTQRDFASLVYTESRSGLSPIYEGKMIWQFDAGYAEPNFWVKKADIEKILYKFQITNQKPISSQNFRLVFRRQSASTNERTLVTTILPPCIHADNLASFSVYDLDSRRLISDIQQVYYCGILNSFIIDYSIRQRVTTNLNFFYLYQLPVPIPDLQNQTIQGIIRLSSKLVCTSQIFDQFSVRVGLSGYQEGVTDPEERANLRAELDAMVAHLYGLTEEEFAHVLSTFPLVDEKVKQAAMREFKEQRK